MRYGLQHIAMAGNVNQLTASNIAAMFKADAQEVPANVALAIWLARHCRAAHMGSADEWSWFLRASMDTYLNLTSRITWEIADADLPSMSFGLIDRNIACWQGSSLFYDWGAGNVLRTQARQGLEYRSIHLHVLFRIRRKQMLAFPDLCPQEEQVVYGQH